MADGPVSTLSAASALTGTELFYADDGVADVKVTATQIRAFSLSAANTWTATQIHTHLTVEGVTSTGATGTGKFVFDGSPTLVTPALGVATATSLAIGGATIGTNALAVTGTANISGALTLGTSGILNGGTNLIEQVNAGSAQTLRVYGFKTDALNYERAFISDNGSGTITFGGQGLGTGAGVLVTISADQSINLTTNNVIKFTINATGAITAIGSPVFLSSTGIPAGGTTGSGIKLSSTSNLGWFFGSGVPTLSAAKGSWYTRTDGSTTNDRAYVNTDGGTTWTALTTAA